MSSTHSANKLHQVKPVIYVIENIDNFGITPAQIYEGTDLNFEKVRQDNAPVSLSDERQICRNIKKYSNDPLVGLKIGSQIQVENFGVLGFATLSAKTRQEALDVFSEYDELIGSHFRFRQEVVNNRMHVCFFPATDIPQDLFSHYCDIMTAGLVFSEGNKEENIKHLKEVHLMHNQNHLKAAYENFFGCKVSFNNDENVLIFDQEFGAIPMPRYDKETSRLCREECHRAIAELNNLRPIHQKVRDIILQKTGYFPGIKEVSQQLVIPERTLRRRLASEGTNYQELLATIRFNLAQEYLKSEISIEKVAELVGYSEAANFSHAFKRWAGLSPRDYRQQVRHQPRQK